VKVNVKLFAAAKDLAGSDSIEIELAEGAAVADVRLAVEARFPSLSRILSHSLWAVDAEYAGQQTPINVSSEIAIIPPVSGG